MKTMMKLMVLMTLTTLSACDYVGQAHLDRDRSDKLYKSAMGDYRAGRLDAAMDAFRRVIQKDPSNASARFQLACLLQDAKSDYLGAFCNYHEYLVQRPDSDKASLAKDRMEKCEVALAKFLAEKHGLLDKGGFAKENEAMKGDLRAAENRTAAAQKEADALRAQVAALKAEQQRLLVIIKGEKDDEGLVKNRPSVKEAKDLLEEDEGVLDRIAISADAAALRVDTDDALTTGSTLLPAQTGKVERVKKDEPKVETPQIPETHVVKEGDTLYGISKRYYGRLSAWKKIREMNKELISADNRLRIGDVLKLPRP